VKVKVKGPPMKLMLSSSCRELAHQQFVSVWEGGIE
jgi:hypothetical protein